MSCVTFSDVRLIDPSAARHQATFSALTPEFRLENLTAVLVVNKIYDSNLTLLYATLSCKLVVIRDLKAQDFGFAADPDVLSPVMVVRLIRSFCRLIHPLTVLR